jgi:hypothetical protein
MPKFTFICEDDPMPFSEGVVTKRTVEFDAVMINDVVSEFELFLRGAGFNPPGILDFVQDDYESEWQTEEFETPQDFSDCVGGSTLDDTAQIQGYAHIKDDDIIHSKFFFDSERNK